MIVQSSDTYENISYTRYEGSQSDRWENEKRIILKSSWSKADRQVYWGRLIHDTDYCLRSQ
jgi:hypothetical protein